MAQRFNHKYIHCSADHCELRDDCIHFLAYQEAMQLGLVDIKVQTRCQDVTQGYVRVRIENPNDKKQNRYE